MNYSLIKSRLAQKQNGAFTSILWERPMKTLKAFSGQTITKRTSAVVRCGIEYDNIGRVIEARATGTAPAVNAGLPWGQWDDYPFSILHKGNRYLRVATVPNTRFTTEYFLNGVKVDKSAVQSMCIKSEFRDGEIPSVLTINTENILAMR